MTRQAGFTTVELIVTLAVGLLAMTFSVFFWLPGIARETMRGAAFDVQGCMQLARVEAVSRNQSCLCVIDATAKTLEVFDTRGTTLTTDDDKLHEKVLSDLVIFARPTSGPPITLTQIGTTQRYVAGFAADGSLSSTQGEVYLFGGDRFGRVALLGAGGTRISRWANNAWSTGS